MADEDKRAAALSSCVGQTQDLVGLVEYSQDSIVSKTLVDKTAGTITLFAFDEGQKLSEHTAPYDAVVQIVDGRARLTVGGKDVKALAGQIVIMPANVPHAVAAEGRFKMLLTMIRA
jgi:quercetin dioxygenase-like cupin family protein